MIRAYYSIEVTYIHNMVHPSIIDFICWYVTSGLKKNFMGNEWCLDVTARLFVFLFLGMIV